MSYWIGDTILVVHNCGAVFGLTWIGDVAELRPAQLIAGKYWLGDTTAEPCPKCGKEIKPFMSRQWVEL